MLILPAAGANAPKSLHELTQPAYQRVAVGLPASVPAGRYTKQVLEHAGLWPALEPRIISTQNVRQALDYVARGEVDAGFVYATDAALMPDKVRVAFVAPSTTPILYPAAPVAASDQPELARAFVAFLGTPAAQAVLARHGFGKP